MQRWSGRVALVTGASSGIGAATVKELVKHGLKVVGVARRIERVEALKSSLKGAPGKLFPLKGDVTKEEDILTTFSWIKKNLGGVDILINNAGVMPLVGLTDEATKEWRQMLELNVLGLSICTREAVKSMKEKGVDDGHIININSIAGQYITPVPQLFFYSATKHAVTVLTDGLRRDLALKNSKIRVTSISPGAVATELVADPSALKFAEGVTLENVPRLQAEDIVNAIIYVLGTPPHVQVHELTIRPLGETY